MALYGMDKVVRLLIYADACRRSLGFLASLALLELLLGWDAACLLTELLVRAEYDRRLMVSYGRVIAGRCRTSRGRL